VGNPPPEVVEDLVEDRHIFWLGQEHGTRAQVDVSAVREVHGLHHAQSVDDLRGGRQQLALTELPPEGDGMSLEVGVPGAAL
jgi:hypothetical protein